MNNRFRIDANQQPSTNWLKKLFNPQGYQSGSLYVPPGVKPYQIKTSDTFENIAQQNNTTVQDLQAANNGMVVPPPKGSYINMPYKSSTPVVPGMNTQLQQNVSRGPGSTSFTSGGSYNVNLTELTSNITKQLQGGQLPTSIPFQASKQIVNPTTGKPFTDADFMASNYTYNNITQSWEQPGAVNPAGVQTNANGKPWEQIVNYNGKNVPAYVAELMAKRQARKARERQLAGTPVTPAEATNAGGVPATTLDVNIGGGD